MVVDISNSTSKASMHHQIKHVGWVPPLTGITMLNSVNMDRSMTRNLGATGTSGVCDTLSNIVLCLSHNIIAGSLLHVETLPFIQL